MGLSGAFAWYGKKQKEIPGLLARAGFWHRGLGPRTALLVLDGSEGQWGGRVFEGLGTVLRVLDGFESLRWLREVLGFERVSWTGLQDAVPLP